ncbi:lipase [Mesorhizobium sp. 1B3]|uniref:lipase n=1 Tax=Mesorhizobium sp. 1B3 TaxID=3243599 RepID=UPI003D95DF47
MNDKTIARRGVFFIGGYDPKTPEAFFDRLTREIARFEKTWDVSAEVSPIDVSADGEVGRVTIRTTAREWAVETDFNFFVLDKIVLGDFARPLPVRLWKYLVTFADYVASGTFFRMARASWRFSLYFLYPFALLMLFAVAAWLVAGWMEAGGMLPGGALVEILLGVALFFGLLATLGKRWPVTHLMDLWSFSRNYLRGKRPDAEAFLARCGKAVASEAHRRGFDEILLVGHSTGGALALDIAAEALKADPLLTARGAEVCVLTLGSTALKVGLHPAGGLFRRKVQALVDDGRLDWLEVQCLTDVINFYKCDPIEKMKLEPRHSGRTFPVIWQVRVRDMLESAVYKRVKRNFFRVHYQYIFGNTKQYFYDFFMICCGPLPLRARAEAKVTGAGATQEPTS